MTLSVAARKLDSPGARTLVPLRQALADLLDGLAPVPAQELALGAAGGAIRAEPLRVATAIPALPLALRPGYAVRAADTFGASAYSPMLLAHAPPHVAAGDALPPGTDAVLEPDTVLVRGGHVEVTDS